MRNYILICVKVFELPVDFVDLFFILFVAINPEKKAKELHLGKINFFFFNIKFQIPQVYRSHSYSVNVLVLNITLLDKLHVSECK